MPAAGHTPLIRTPLVRAYLLIVRAVGGDVGGLIQRYSLPANVEALPEVELPLARFRDLGDEASSIVGNPHLGFRLASIVDRGQFGLFEFILRSSSTMRQGCQLAIRYSGLVNDLTDVSMVEADGEVAIDERIPGEPLGGGRQGNEFLITVFTRLIRECFSADWRPRRVWFAHPSAGDVSELIAYFRTDQIAFLTGSNGFAFDPAELDLPVVSSDSALLSVLERQAQMALAARPAVGDLISRVRERVRLAVRDGTPQLEVIAPLLGMSARTLQRRLADDHTSFQAVVDDVRETLARLYVADRTLTVADVAFLLGYSDTRAFLRAFRRWTAMSPSEYRERDTL